MNIKLALYLGETYWLMYQLKCSQEGCSADYIGKSGRLIGKRWAEHFDVVERAKKITVERMELLSDLENIKASMKSLHCRTRIKVN